MHNDWKANALRTILFFLALRLSGSRQLLLLDRTSRVRTFFVSASQASSLIKRSFLTSIAIWDRSWVVVLLCATTLLVYVAFLLYGRSPHAGIGVSEYLI